MRTKPVAGLGGVIVALALFAWDEAIFAAPIIAMTHFAGAWPTFGFMTIAYGAVSFAVAVACVHSHDRRIADGKVNRLDRWASRQSASRRGSWAARLVQTGWVIGFVASSAILGGIITTWTVRVARPRTPLLPLAATSSAIFAIAFVGLYSGVGHLLFGR